MVRANRPRLAVCELLVPHRERHHSLGKTGFAEELLGMSIEQIENLFAALLDLPL